MEYDYKVKASGELEVFNRESGRRTSRLTHELAVPLRQRSQVRRLLPRELVLGAWVLRGTRVVPADINELVPFRKVVSQVLKDAPALLPVMLVYLRSGHLSPEPVGSITNRMKDLLRRNRVRLGPAPRGTKERPFLRKRPTEADRFWQEQYQRGTLGRETPQAPLTEVGWRYLTWLPFTTLRGLRNNDSLEKESFMAVLNICAEFQFPALSTQEIEMVKLLAGLRDRDDSRHALVAYREHVKAGNVLTAEELDYVEEQVCRKNGHMEVKPGTQWHKLVEDAWELAAAKADWARLELEQYKWAVPFDQMEIPGGYVVEPIADTHGLIEEGYEMSDFRIFKMHAAQQAADGLALVMRLTGNGTRATLELTRARSGGPWGVSKLLSRHCRPVGPGPLLNAARYVARWMNGEH